MPTPTDFDDSPLTVIDGEPVDATADVDVVDEAAELLAVDGPPDGARELTPTATPNDACGFCLLVAVQRVADFTPAPRTCSEAWHFRTCCARWDGSMAWCQLRGFLAVDGKVTDCNRRKVPRGTPPEGTPERRRPAR